jgi:hypothetical protein
MRGHCKCIISSCNQFKDGRPTANMVKYQRMQCDSAFACEGYCTSGNSLPVSGGVNSTHKFGNRCEYGAMLLIMAGQMISCDPDAKPHPLQMTVS